MKYIFEIRLKSGHTPEDYREAWEKGSEIVQKELGAQGTKLYQKIEDPNTLLAIATWESKEARDKAMDRLDGLPEDIQKILHRQSEMADFNRLGNFEEISQVNPKD